MDAAARAELDELRRRAYGPEADLDGDGVDRLIELEDLVLREHFAPADPEAPAVTAPGAEMTAGTGQTAVTGEPRAEAPSRRRSLALLMGVATVAVVVALAMVTLLRTVAPTEATPGTGATPSPVLRDSRAAYTFALDVDAVTLLNIPLDGSFGNYVDLPSTGHVPHFPARGEVEWASHLGEYFGWEVWIAGAAGQSPALPREHCIVVEHEAVWRGRCVSAELRSQSALLVAVPFSLVSADERPVGMGPDDRLGFWWNHDRAVTVLLGDDPQH
jgi:hypothetical protein